MDLNNLSLFLDSSQQFLDSFELDYGFGTASSSNTASSLDTASVGSYQSANSVSSVVPEDTSSVCSVSSNSSTPSSGGNDYWKYWKCAGPMYSGKGLSHGCSNPDTVSKANPVQIRIDPDPVSQFCKQLKLKVIYGWSDKLDNFPADVTDSYAVDKWFWHAFPYFEGSESTNADNVKMLLESIKDNRKVHDTVEWEVWTHPEQSVHQLLNLMWRLYADPDSMYLALLSQLLQSRQKKNELLTDFFFRLHMLSFRIWLRYPKWQDIEDE